MNWASRLLDVGPDVTNVQPGDRCSIEPYLNCQKCYACRRGHTNCCETNQTLGVHCDGGLRPKFLIPARKLHVSKKLIFEQLALVETLAIGCHADQSRRHRTPTNPASLSAPVPSAWLRSSSSKLTGAKVIVMDMNQQRLDFCEKVMGVQHTLKPSDNVDKDLRDLTDGHLPDVVIDATGHVGSMSNAFSLVTHAGRLVFVGITQDEVRFRHPIFHKSEGTLLCSRNALAPEFTRIIQLIEDGRIDTRPWITHRAAFEELIDVFPSYTRPETGVIKAVVAVGD